MLIAGEDRSEQFCVFCKINELQHSMRPIAIDDEHLVSAHLSFSALILEVL